MTMEELDLSFQEQVIFRLRALYNRQGYRRFRMNKFEEYDFYARNKAFLLSDHVITFTDLNGRLMALKPDVTLSIVKSSRDQEDAIQKVYYNETVYRPAHGGHAFREWMQVGLECIGAIDDDCIAEVLTLAAESLDRISRSWVLNVSHLGLLASVMDAAGVRREYRQQILKFTGEKNIHELSAFCRSCGMEERYVAIFRKLMDCCGEPDQVLPELRCILEGHVDLTALNQLENGIQAMGKSGRKEVIRVDLSAVDDMRYYSGIVFKGYIQGVPGSVLSGGQYDHLMQKMGRTAGAIGFAVYIDDLERLEPAEAAR